MSTLIQPHDLTSGDPTLVARSVDLNSEYHSADVMLGAIMGSDKVRPIARYVNRDDIADPPAPAWYLPAANDIYIHTDEAGVDVTEIDWRNVWDTKDRDTARILGLLCHETGHAAISDHMTPVQLGAKKHWDLLTLLEELRVENHAMRKAPTARKFLRASFGIILDKLPATFETKAHVVRAWAITRGRTLAGIADAAETDAVDIAARTLLGDDIVDGLTDLLQEALTLRLARPDAKVRMVEICDEWRDLVGETAEGTGCTECAREAKPGEKPNTKGKGEGNEKADGDGDGDDAEDEGGDGTGTGSNADTGDDDAAPGDDDADESGDDTTGGSHWGTPGADIPDDEDTSATGDEPLTDEEAELIGMLARDLADTMKDEWVRDNRPVEVASAAEWATKVFGNRAHSDRLTRSEPSAEARQHVVQVAQALSRLSLPMITKTARSAELPPGRLRSREAVRASAERAQGRMITARPWRGTVRRHSMARPLVVGVATDTSGSMKWAEWGVAEFAYVYTNAGHRIGARTAAVTFGDTVHRIARPGEVMTHVERKSASDSSEQFDHAMASLDGVLHLTAPAYAARILLVISDGQFVKSGEPDRAMEWLRRMDRAGTHVLWIKDRDDSGYNTWLRRAPKKLKGLTLVDVESTGRYRAGERRVFELLNRAALGAIAEHTG